MYRISWLIELIKTVDPMLGCFLVVALFCGFLVAIWYQFRCFMEKQRTDRMAAFAKHSREAQEVHIKETSKLAAKAMESKENVAIEAIRASEKAAAKETNTGSKKKHKGI